MEFYKEKEDGAVLVFLVLVLVSILSLLGTFLEIARTQSAKLYYQEALDAGADSLGASYCRELYEEYGLFFYWQGEADPAEEIKEILSYYENPDQDLFIRGRGIYGLENMEVTVNEITRACDKELEPLKEQMILLGKGMCAAEVIGKVTGELELFGRGTDLKEQVEQRESDYESEDWYQKYVEQNQGISSESPGQEPDSEVDPGAEGETEGREDFETQLKENWDSEIWSKIKEVLTHPLEALLLPENTEISENAFPEEAFSLGGIGTDTEENPTGEELLNRVFLSEYILTHTGNFCDPASEEGLRYETEQILFAKNQDRENLNAAWKRLMAVREGLNLMYLVSDEESLGFVQEAAALLVGWTGIPPLIEGMKYLLLAVWAGAESIVDVRALLQEDKVPFLKSKETWNLTMEKLPLWLSGEWEKGETEDGLTYEEYLRLLLLLRSEDTLTARMGGLIQFHMQQYESEFLLRDCIESMTVRMTAILGSGFLLVPSQQSAAGRLHQIQLKTRFSYRKEEP